MLVYTDHSAVRAVLETPSASGKHARWWSKLFSSGLRSIKIVYRPGKDNASADALSRCPISAPHNDIVVDDPVQIAQLESSSPVITDQLNAEPFKLGMSQTVDFASEQSKDPVVNDMIQFLTTGTLPDDVQRSRKVAAQAPSFTMIDNILYYLDSTKRDRKRCVVPLQLRQQVMEEYHSGPLSGHFSGDKLYKTLVNHWWWQGMYSDVLKHCSSCPQCAIVNPSGRVNKPPLQPIPVSRPFQILGVDIMDLPYTEAGNKHTGEKPNFLLFGVDCRTPTEPAFLPPSQLQITDVTDYREELTMALSTARNTAVASIQKAQHRYKQQYDKDVKPLQVRLGDWVLVRFPADESGRNRKLSRPWHGPFRVTAMKGPDVEASNVYFPQDDLFLIHQSRVKACPHNFPGGFYWYGGRRRGLGKPPQWVEDLLRGPDKLSEQYTQDAASLGTDGSSEQHTEGATPPHFDELSKQHTEDSVQQEYYGSSERSTKDATLPNISPPYNLRRDPQPSFKALETQARD